MSGRTLRAKSPTLLVFDPSPEPQFQADETEALEAVPISVAQPVEEQTISLDTTQTKLDFQGDEESITISSRMEQMPQSFMSHLDEPEVAIIALLRSQPGLGAKQISEKLNLEKKEVNRYLYGRLSSYVECDERFRWRLTAS